jgi:hypothetical protein
MEEAKTNAGQGLGIASLIIGIIAIIMAVIPCIGLIAIIPGVVALVFSIIALNQANNGNGAKGLIIAALVISILATSVAILWGFVFSKTISNKSWWKTKIEKAIETEINHDDSAIKHFGDDLEGVLEELEAEADSGAINKIESGTPMSDEEFDKFLKNYEKLIVQVIDLKKKYKDGNVSAARAYTEVSLKLTEISLKIVSASSSLTPEQYKKLKELNNKYKDQLDLNTLE